MIRDLTALLQPPTASPDPPDGDELAQTSDLEACAPTCDMDREEILAGLAESCWVKSRSLFKCFFSGSTLRVLSGSSVQVDFVQRAFREATVTRILRPGALY